MRRAFTMVEILLAALLLGVLTTVSVMTFNAVSRGWQVSTDYMDKMQRTDFALNQVVSGLRSMYYPHDGKQDERYGFVLVDNGDGDAGCGKLLAKRTPHAPRAARDNGYSICKRHDSSPDWFKCQETWFSIAQCKLRCSICPIVSRADALKRGRQKLSCR